MMRSSSARPDEIAAAWVARIDRGLSASEQAELDRWLAADDRQLGAFVRAQALFVRADMAREVDPPISVGTPGGIGQEGERVALRPFGGTPAETSDTARRRFLRVAGMAATGIGLGGVGSAWLWSERQERYATRRGEVRVVALSDGSIVTLNAQSEILVAYRRTRRTILLRAGDALFDVAKDKARPFTVYAGAMEVTAVGTSFAVSSVPASGARVVVSEGVIDVRGFAEEPRAATRLGANMVATLLPDASLHAARLEAAAVERELQWREGRLQFAGEPLKAAAAQFARYSDVAIVIDDPLLRHEEISGTFVALDPLGFSRAVAEALGAQVRVSQGAVHLTREAPLPAAG